MKFWVDYQATVPVEAESAEEAQEIIENQLYDVTPYYRILDVEES